MKIPVLRTSLGSLWLLACAPPALALDFGLELAALSNPANAAPAEERLESAAAAAWLAQDWRLDRGPRETWILALDAAALGVERYSGLSHGVATATAGWRRRLGGSYGAATLGFTASAGGAAFSSSARDRAELDVAASLSRHWTTRLSGGLEVGWRREWARGPVFRLERARAAGHVDWRMTRRDALYLDYRYANGRFSASGEPPNAALLAAADRIRPDDAVPGANAYRLTGHAHALSLGWNRQLAARRALDIRLRAQRVHAGVRYPRLELAVGMLWSR